MISEAIRVMVWGMMGIFIVLSVVYIVIKLLIRIFPEK